MTAGAAAAECIPPRCMETIEHAIVVVEMECCEAWRVNTRRSENVIRRISLTDARSFRRRAITQLTMICARRSIYVRDRNIEHTRWTASARTTKCGRRRSDNRRDGAYAPRNQMDRQWTARARFHTNRHAWRLVARLRRCAIRISRTALPPAAMDAE